MLRLATKATFAVCTATFVIAPGDTRFRRNFIPACVVSEDAITLDLNYFRQGGYNLEHMSSVVHHSVEGSLVDPALVTSIQEFSATLRFGDGYGDDIVATYTTEVHGNITFYLAAISYPNYWGRHAPHTSATGMAFEFRDGYIVQWRPDVYVVDENLYSDHPMAYLRSLKPLDGWSWNWSCDIDQRTSQHSPDTDLIVRRLWTVCDTIVSEDRKNQSSIHDTLCRESLNDADHNFDHVNNIDNIRSALNVAKSIISGKFAIAFPELIQSLMHLDPSSLGQLWLSYRYAFMTTKLDIKEEMDRLARDLPTAKNITGRATMTVGNTVYHATSIIFPESYHTLIGKISQALERYGLAPTWANLWDLLPFTFIADWFLPFSNFSEQVRLQEDLTESLSSEERKYSIKSFVYSRKTCISIPYPYDDWVGHISLSYYDRSCGDYPAVSSEICWYDPGKTSLKTWSRRILDGVALLVS